MERAKALMVEHAIRHLPVLRGDQLVGILTERDVRLIETLDGVDPRLITVSDAMATEVYSVSPETPLEMVAAEMAEHKYGSAVVMRGPAIVGVFTTVDASRALAELLRSTGERDSKRLPEPPTPVGANGGASRRSASP